MKTEVLVERLPDHRFRATGFGRFALSAEGASAEEAIANFRQAAFQTLPAASTIISVDIPLPSSPEEVVHPWKQIGGILADDPYFDEWQEEIRRNRELDEQETARRDSPEAPSA